MTVAMETCLRRFPSLHWHRIARGPCPMSPNQKAYEWLWWQYFRCSLPSARVGEESELVRHEWSSLLTESRVPKPESKVPGWLACPWEQTLRLSASWCGEVDVGNWAGLWYVPRRRCLCWLLGGFSWPPKADSPARLNTPRKQFWSGITALVREGWFQNHTQAF